MKYHLITAAVLLVALAFYVAGMAGVGTAAFLVAVAFETWFWARIVIERPPGTGSPSAGR